MLRYSLGDSRSFVRHDLRRDAATTFKRRPIASAPSCQPLGSALTVVEANANDLIATHPQHNIFRLHRSPQSVAPWPRAVIVGIPVSHPLPSALRCLFEGGQSGIFGDLRKVLFITHAAIHDLAW